jgi:hypothetical protein
MSIHCCISEIVIHSIAPRSHHVYLNLAQLVIQLSEDRLTFSETPRSRIRCAFSNMFSIDKRIIVSEKVIRCLCHFKG